MTIYVSYKKNKTTPVKSNSSQNCEFLYKNQL